MLLCNMSAEISTSSIDAVWPPDTEASNNRVRGFYPAIVETEPEVDGLILAHHWAQEVARNHPTADRMSLRAVVDRGVVPVLGEAGLKVEAALPIAGNTGKFIVYTAWN